MEAKGAGHGTLPAPDHHNFDKNDLMQVMTFFSQVDLMSGLSNSISIYSNTLERVKEVGLSCIPELWKCKRLVKKALLVGCQE